MQTARDEFGRLVGCNAAEVNSVLCEHPQPFDTIIANAKTKDWYKRNSARSHLYSMRREGFVEMTQQGWYRLSEKGVRARAMGGLA